MLAKSKKRFTVKSSNEGDVVDGLNFTLQSMVKDTTASAMIKEVSDTVSLSDNVCKAIVQNGLPKLCYDSLSLSSIAKLKMIDEKNAKYIE